MTLTTALVLGGIVLLLIGMGLCGLFLVRRPTDAPPAAAEPADPSTSTSASPWPKVTLASIDAAVAAEADPPDVRGIAFPNPSKNPYDV